MMHTLHMANTTTQTVTASNLRPGMRGGHFEVAAVETAPAGHVRVKLTSRTGSGCAGVRYYAADHEFEILVDGPTLPAVGSKVTATDGRRFVVQSVHEAGANTTRVTGSVAMLGLRLDSKRAKANYAANLYTNGDVVVLFTV